MLRIIFLKLEIDIRENEVFCVALFLEIGCGAWIVHRGHRIHQNDACPRELAKVDEFLLKPAAPDEKCGDE